MATNTAASFTNHTGNGSTANFSISFSYLSTAEIDVTVGGVLKTLGTHYTITGSTLTFTSGNIPSNGTAIKFQRDTDISAKKVDFADGSVLTETDLDNNSDQILFAQQEINDIVTNDLFKRDGSQTLTGSIVFEGSSDDANETTISVTNPTADRTITFPDVSGAVVTTGDTGSITTSMVADNAITGAKIASQTISGSDIANNTITANNIASNAVDTAELNANSVTTAKITDSNVTTAKIADNAVTEQKINALAVTTGRIAQLGVTTEKIAANAVTTNKIQDDAVTIDKIADAAIVLDSEQASHTVDNNTLFTTAAAEARYFNASTGETIKNGQTFPDNDTTIATTAAINDRIIDLVDDVGGFVPITNELSFPNTNPDINNGAGTLVSIKALSTAYTSDGSGNFTISNGTLGGSTVTINGATASTTFAAGFGMILETTTVLNTYTFHRLVPKATEVTTVAGSISNVNTVAGSISNVNTVAGNIGNVNTVAGISANVTTVANDGTDIGTVATNISNVNTVAGISGNVTTVAGISSNVTTVANNNSNINTVAGNNANITTVAGISSNVTTVANDGTDIGLVAGSISNVNTTAGSIANVNTVAGSISNVNTVGTNITNVTNASNYLNNFLQLYLGEASSNPTVDGLGNAVTEGDLYFNTVDKRVRVFNGSVFQNLAEGAVEVAKFATAAFNTLYTASAGSNSIDLGGLAITGAVFSNEAIAANRVSLAKGSGTFNLGGI